MFVSLNDGLGSGIFDAYFFGRRVNRLVLVDDFLD